MVTPQLISALRAGDQAAFKQLVAIYQDKVFNTAISLVQDHGTAEDIAQEVFVTVYRSILSFNEKSSVSTWIYRITVNKCLDHLRAAGRQKRQSLLSRMFANDNTAAMEAQPTFEHPGVLLERKEQAAALFAAINTLPENQKTVFVLVHIEELPQKEVAEIMDISVKAVESLLQRAKAGLRKKLGSMYDRRKKE